MTDKTIKYLANYQAPNFLVDTINLFFTLNNDDSVSVTSITKYFKNPGSTTFTNQLFLDGTAKLISCKLNDQALAHDDFTHSNHGIMLSNLEDEFTLTIETLVFPNNNKTCSGLFRSGDMLVTQCEPEGFRLITFYPDHPDILAKFTTTITAPASQYPVLLANGNKVKEEINNDLKTVCFVDNFKKPCYLFALVMGNLEVIRDSFITKSGRKINLEIYSAKTYIALCTHAMNSLKEAMRWDEKRFNLEYDLDNYMIVASSDFNMGAMENKGLNVFNTKYVAVDTKTATDIDFINVEAVIGHEYFHNWTGNRVTCRDWFQLSLKEGLTVFRDHEFTADLHGKSVWRINNVNRLIQSQFPEDNGPLAHPVRPDHYIEVNNFYTTTIYEKGAEVVRMYQTILGENDFNRGIALYLNRHDGEAATCEDFYQAMVEVSTIDLSGFMLWYQQDGTPQVTLTSTYDQVTQKLLLTFNQINHDSATQKNKKPLLIPIKIGMLDPNGQEMQIAPNVGKYSLHEDGLVLLLTDTTNIFEFTNVSANPYLSVLRDFSAPIKLNFAQNMASTLFLVNNDSNDFNRYQCLRNIFIDIITNTYHALLAIKPIPAIPEEILASIRSLLENQTLDPEYLALILKTPTFNELLSAITAIDPGYLNLAINHLQAIIGEELFDAWIECYNLNLVPHYQFADHGKRSLKNLALFYIIKALAVKGNNQSSLQLIETMVLGQYYNSDNMTDTIATLLAINDLNLGLRDEIFNDFYSKWATNELVMDKWFLLEATCKNISTQRLNQLLVDKAFIATNPNKLYALIRGFTTNPYQFHSDSGYEFIVWQIINIDKFNPQIASIVARGFNSVTNFKEKYRIMAKNALDLILKQENISGGLFEVVNQIANGLKNVRSAEVDI